MNDVVQEAVEVMWPVLAAGGLATAQGAAEEGGARLFQATGSVIARIRHRIPGDSASREQLQDALRAGLDAGEVQEDELRKLAPLAQGVSIGSITAEKVVLTRDITINNGNFYV